MTNAELYQAQLEQAQKRKRGLLRYIKELRATMRDLRPVEWSKFHNGKLIPVGQAMFHQFGLGFDPIESETVVSTAIIELPDGTVRNVPVEHIKFLG